MNNIINKCVIIISEILIGFVLIMSIIPNIVLNTIIILGCFALPMFIIIITMIIQIKKEKEILEKEKIRKFWFKVLFIIYCLLLVTVLFLNNEYRMGRNFQNTNTFSKEHFELSNIIPFSTVIGYIKQLIEHDINTNIVIVNIFTNLVLFAPMGLFVPVLFKDKIKNTKQFIVIMIVITGIVEILQFITYRGSTDIDDIILNTIGAIIIYLFMKTNVAKRMLNKIFDM